MSAPTTRSASEAPPAPARLADDRFLPLPVPVTCAGRARRTGVELEFGGLDEDRAARIVVDCLGGRRVPAGHHAARVEGSALGTVRIELDTRYRADAPSGLRAALLDLARRVVPVEIVTDPLPPERLPRLDDLREALRAAGAVGSGGGALLGFGLHLNPEIAAPGAVVPVVRSYALIEDWLRRHPALDRSRRVLPFVDPYPRRFVDRVAAEGAGWDLDRLAEVYLRETPSRNRGLDLLPLLRHRDEARVLAALGEDAAAVGARPAFHYRLPDCRVDEPGWRIAHEWNRWRLVEVVAADPGLLDRLSADWLAHRRAGGTTADWRRAVGACLAGLPDPVPPG